MRRVVLVLMVAVLAITVLVEGCSLISNRKSGNSEKETVAEAEERTKATKAEASNKVKAEAEAEKKVEPREDAAKNETEAEIKSKTEAEAEDKSEPEPEPEVEPQVYVLVDLSEQHLSVVKATEVSEKPDGEVLFETGIVSGTADTSRATSTGTYEVYAKVPGKYLRPRDGSEVWVDYWMPFNGGVGLHDASWRSLDQFGTDQYKWSGSHGCINLPHDAAATIYDLIGVGTTVLVVE